MSKVTSELTDFLNKANELIQLGIEEGFVLTPEIARSNLAKLAYFSSPQEAVAAVIEHKLTLPDREVPVRIYQPEIDNSLPVLIYFHGGGHMCGSVEIFDSVARRLANSTKHIVVSVDYRLAPEFPYPCGLDDCLAVVDNLDQILAEIPYQDNQVSIGGDSAGGALAVSVANQTLRPIHKLVLFYPSLDYTFSADSYLEFAQGYLLETNRIEWYFDHYFNKEDNRKKASPLFFENLESLPPSLIVAAGLDPLVGEGRLFHEKLISMGIEAQYHLEADLLHAFLNLGALIPQHIERVYGQVSNFLNE